MFAATTSDTRREGPERDEKSSQATATTEYCAKLQQWMWQYHWGYASWQSWVALSAFPFPPACSFPPPGRTPGTPGSTPGSGQQAFDTLNRYSYPYPLGFPASYPHPGAPHAGQTSATDARPAQLQNGNPPQAGREYTIPSPLQRFLAETVDFFILFCVKATIVLWIMHLSGMKDIAKFITHFIVEEIDENTSMEDLQKMMAVALVYRVLVCIYETICIWGAGGATPGKFLLGLRVVTCDTSTLVRPNRVLVVPASKVSLSASKVNSIRSMMSSSPSLPPSDTNTLSASVLSPLHLAEVQESHVEEILRNMKSWTCTLDPIPTALLKSHIPTLSPFISKVVNFSLRSGCVPPALKVAVIRPLLK